MALTLKPLDTVRGSGCWKSCTRALLGNGGRGGGKKFGEKLCHQLWLGGGAS